VERRELWCHNGCTAGRESPIDPRVLSRAGPSEPAFYAWRQRLKTGEQVRFALVETKAAVLAAGPIELILAGGDRLQIPADAATLRLVLGVLREQA